VLDILLGIDTFFLTMSKYINISKLVLTQAIVNIALFAMFYFLLTIVVNPFFVIVLILLSLLLFYFINKYLLGVFIDDKINKIYKVLGSNTDISGVERKKKSFAEIENEVENWVKAKYSEIIDLKRTENFRKEFLGNISHELKTPIFIAQSYIETLLDGSIDDKEVNRKHLKKSLSSIVRLSTIVNELEMISKLERDIGDLPKEVFNINALICEVLDSLDIKIKKENVFINKDSIANKKCLVVANKDKIEQVVYNLLENALKYRAKNNSKIKISTFANKGKCLIKIEDNGIGIKVEDQARIFERFYRVDKHRSRKKGGAGLGLAIVKHIIEAHNQSIKVESEYGKGTRFQFTLALA